MNTSIDENKQHELRSQTDVTILVNSCDLYEDAWEPFLKLLHIQWPTLKYDIVLNTENKKYHGEFGDVKTVCGGNVPWGTRLKKCLEQIETEFVMFFLEDAFLREKVNVEGFSNAVAHMKNNPDIGCIFLRQTGKQIMEFEEKFFDRNDLIEKTKQWRLVGLCALYRRDYLVKLIRNHEDAWEFEKYASMRSIRLPYKVLQYNKKYPPIFVHDDDIKKGFGISKRRWLPKNKELFEENGILVNYENLGWYEDLLENRKQTTEVVSKSRTMEYLYLIKKQVVRLPERIKSYIRKIKSLL